MADLLRFITFYVVNLSLLSRELNSFFHVACSNLLCMLPIASSQTSSIMAEKKSLLHEFLLVHL